MLNGIICIILILMDIAISAEAYYCDDNLCSNEQARINKLKIFQILIYYSLFNSFVAERTYVATMLTTQFGTSFVCSFP